MTHRPRMRARRRLTKAGAVLALDIAKALGIDERKLIAPMPRVYSSARESMIREFNRPWRELWDAKLFSDIDPDEPLISFAEKREPTFKPPLVMHFDLECRPPLAYDFSEATERVYAKVMAQVLEEQERMAILGLSPQRIKVKTLGLDPTSQLAGDSPQLVIIDDMEEEHGR